MLSTPMTEFPLYTKLRGWVEIYGSAGIEDRRALMDFIDCETRESVKSLQVELEAMAKGNFEEKIIDQLVGVKRRIKHSSYDTWAKMMLLWMAEYKP